MIKVVLAVGSACALAGCASGVQSSAPAKADIGKVVAVKSSFGPEFQLKDIARRPVDAGFFTERKLPAGVNFDPPECGNVVLAPTTPSGGVQGSMVGVSAEGDGNKFEVIAVQTSPAVPLNYPSHHCGTVAFTAPHMRGSVETVDAPGIQGAHTLGVHRMVQALKDDSAHTTELYRYSAQFGEYDVMVIATPLAAEDQPAAPVDTQRARDLLVSAVAAIRS
jgi:Domain of unknown function (DUF5642)